eukprot:3903663-Prymnesium_polylepis.1
MYTAKRLEEVLGFEVGVAHTPMAWSNTNNSPLSRIRDGYIDANLETWAADWPEATVDDYVTSRAVARLVHTYFEGRVGIYVPTKMVHAHPELYLDYWRPYQSSEAKDTLIWQNTTQCVE